MKKFWVAILALTYSVFAGNVFNRDGSINKESDEYKKANMDCIFDGCDYDDWTISGGIQYSQTGMEGDWNYSFNGFSSSQDYLYFRFAFDIKTDFWNSKSTADIPVFIRIKAENGYKYDMVSEGNGKFLWVKTEDETKYESIYEHLAHGNKNGFHNVNVLKLSSLNSGSLSFEVIYLNESLNRRYGKKYTIYVRPKK